MLSLTLVLLSASVLHLAHSQQQITENGYEQVLADWLAEGHIVDESQGKFNS